MTMTVNGHSQGCRQKGAPSTSKTGKRASCCRAKYLKPMCASQTKHTQCMLNMVRALSAHQMPAQYSQGDLQLSQASPSSTRRSALVSAAAAVLAVCLSCEAKAAVAGAEVTTAKSRLGNTSTASADAGRNAAQGPSLDACRGPVDGHLAAALTRSVYSAVVSLQVMPEQEFQKEVFKFRDREYPYYRAANSDQLPSLPDLSDNTGGLSNAAYLNFVLYCLWKVVASHVSSPEARTQFCQVAGEHLLSSVWPEANSACKVARGSAGGAASESQLVPLIMELLKRLKAGGYACAYQLVWDEQPGSWPGNWMDVQPSLVGSVGAGPASGSTFQVKLYRPADLAGSVAMRSENDGFWARVVSSMMRKLLADAGYPQVTCEEFFFQDSWQPPSKVSDQLLLFFGDPLEQVDVPFQPSTLIQDWQLGKA